MSNLKAGQKVTLHIPDAEAAERKGIHVIDEKQELTGQVLCTKEDGAVDVSVLDHGGTWVRLQDVATSKAKAEDDIYVTAAK